MMTTMIPVMKPLLGDEEAQAAAAAVASGWVAQGPRVREFEEAFRARIGAADAVAVSSCTTGLHLALVLAGVGPGDEVVVPSLSFIATANAVRYVGATPGVRRRRAGHAEPDRRDRRAGDHTADTAVILVHQAGIPADIDAVQAFCDPTRDRRRRGRRLRDRIDVSRRAHRAPQRSRRLLVPPPQARHHRRGRDAHDQRRRRWAHGPGGCASTA